MQQIICQQIGQSVLRDLLIVYIRASCIGKRSSCHLDNHHLYAPLPVAYLERGGVTSLCDDVNDDVDASEGDELRGAMSVTYTSSDE